MFSLPNRFTKEAEVHSHQLATKAVRLFIFKSVSQLKRLSEEELNEIGCKKFKVYLFTNMMHVLKVLRKIKLSLNTYP